MFWGEKNVLQFTTLQIFVLFHNDSVINILFINCRDKSERSLR